MGIVREVECSKIDVAFDVLVFASLHVVRYGVVHRLSVVAANAKSQAWYGVVVYTGRKTVLVGSLKLKRLGCARLYPLVA